MHPAIGFVLLVGLAKHACGVTCLRPLTVDQPLRDIWANSIVTTGVPVAVYINPCPVETNQVHVQYVVWHGTPGYEIFNILVEVAPQNEGYRLTENHQQQLDMPPTLMSLPTEYFDNLPIFNSVMGDQCRDYSDLDTTVVGTCVPGLTSRAVQWNKAQVAARVYGVLSVRLNIPINPALECLDMTVRHEPCPGPPPASPVVATNLCTLGIFSAPRKLAPAFFYNVWLEVRHSFTDEQDPIPLQVTIGSCGQHTAQMLWLVWLTGKAPLLYSGTVGITNPPSSVLLEYQSNTWRETPTVTTIESALLFPPDSMMRSAVTECIDYKAIPSVTVQNCLVADTLQQYPQRDLVHQQIFASSARLSIPVNVPEIDCAQDVVQLTRCPRTRTSTLQEQSHVRLEARTALYTSIHTLLPTPLGYHKNMITHIDENTLDLEENELLLHISYYEVDFSAQTNTTPRYYDLRAVYVENALAYTVLECVVSQINSHPTSVATSSYDCSSEPICFYRTAKWYHHILSPSINNGTVCPAFFDNTQCNPLQEWWIIFVYYVYTPCVALFAIVVIIKRHYQFISEFAIR